MTGPQPDRELIGRAVGILAEGGLVAFPTETVYGLGADAETEAAVRAIFAAKGRPADHPVIVHLLNVDVLAAWIRGPSSGSQDRALRLATAFWPGPLTLVVPASPRALPVVTGGQDTVGLRSPAHPWARALLEGWCARRGDPAAGLAAPSANRFGQLSPTTAAHVRDGLGVKPAGPVDLVLDGGACDVGIESTIVDLSGATPRILRPGAIGAEAMSAVLGMPVEVAARSADAPRAPGRLEQHYAPRTPLELVAPAALSGRLNVLRGARIGLLAPPAALLDAPPQVVRRLVASSDPATYARDLYRALHELDASGVDLILVTVPPEGTAWAAVRDRLERAAARG